MTTYKPGDIVVLDDGDRIRITEVEADIKNGIPGGVGVTLNNPERRKLVGLYDDEHDDIPDRWFYHWGIVYTVPDVFTMMEQESHREPN